MEKYVDLLKSHGLKVTHQRLRILEYVDHYCDHPTADTIYTALKDDHPSLSRTTVYNTLEILSEAGIINQLTISPTEHRYDMSEEMHHHFICKKCHTVYDIEFSCPYTDEIKKKAEKQGHQINEIQGIFKGICRDCIKKTVG